VTVVLFLDTLDVSEDDVWRRVRALTQRPRHATSPEDWMNNALTNCSSTGDRRRQRKANSIYRLRWPGRAGVARRLPATAGRHASSRVDRRRRRRRALLHYEYVDESGDEGNCSRSTHRECPVNYLTTALQPTLVTCSSCSEGAENTGAWGAEKWETREVTVATSEYEKWTRSYDDLCDWSAVMCYVYAAVNYLRPLPWYCFDRRLFVCLWTGKSYRWIFVKLGE